MILTCPQCQAQYKLDPAALGTAGRDVRCVSCSHMWFQIPETAVAEPQKMFVDVPEPVAEPAQSVTQALHNILEKDDAAFEAVLSTVAQGAKAKESKPQEVPEAIPRPEPEARRKSVIKQDAVIVTHNPFGLGADVFGGLVFLLCCFVTLAALFAGKSPIVREWPQMSLLYRTMGFSVKVPGEGLRLSEITAERRIDENSKSLVLEGKMTNMTEHDIAYPTLHVMLKNSSNGITKIWDIKPGVTQIASGDVVPVMLQLDNPPEDGSTVEVRVKEGK
jgi:predicted Zn finger-like uncharacterized protein